MTSVMASVTSSAAISLPNNNRMSPSSTGDSPLSMGGTSSSGRVFPLPNRDNFTVEIPPLSVGANANGSSLKSPNSAKAARTTNFSRDGILGSAQKARNMSQSSEARPEQMTIELQKVSSDENMNPLKRRNTDATVDYPRRRATIACEVCRSRKSRCDGTKPKCKLCTELGAECIYREPGIKLDAGDKLILERLNRIESLLQMSIVNNPNGIHISENSPPISNGTGLTGDNLLANANGNFVSMIPSSGLGTWTNQPPSSISTMPKVHTNAALHLLQWPLIRDLIQRPYDPQILLQLEMAREPLPSLAKTPCVDLSNTHAYIEAYFDRVNVCVLAAQCHLLAAAYLFYLVRPLEAWNLLCTTSSKLQLLLMTPTRIPEDQRELSERIYWNALLFESDLLAELDLPHSGVVQLEEHVGLPGGFQGEESEAVGRDDLWYFLAEIALRRLLNRVSQLIYSKDSMASTTSLEPVVAELDFQLTQCLAGHMPYLWQGALSIVSQTLLVMGATMSPSLSSILLTLVPHREVIDQIINDVIMDIERMSVLAPSLSLAAEIIKEAEVRRRTFLSG
ncbi:hypothetical protein KJ359_008186 [Pestalotiopsis sp. 9143b]|nr:hypothetical protein KJ359_008186 [Pestalotiopsis sp. 9143b]